MRSAHGCSTWWRATGRAPASRPTAPTPTRPRPTPTPGSCGCAASGARLAPGGVTLATLPAGVRAQVLLTISANWGDGVLEVPSYLKAIREIDPNAGSTVFVATRNATDWLDDALLPDRRRLRRAHRDRRRRRVGRTGARRRARQRVGQPHAALRDAAARQRPRDLAELRAVHVERKTTEGATLLGELLVSRALLRQFQPDVPTFRAPYLLSSQALAPAEDAVGYRYESSTTQGWTQTAFPFHPPRLDDKGFADVFSFPITVEDEADGGLRKRIDEASGVASAAIDNGAPATILIHPRAEADWRAAAVKLIAVLRDRYGKGLSVDGVGTFGAFWSQRDHLGLMTGPAAAGACGGRRRRCDLRLNHGSKPAVRQSLTVTDPALHHARLLQRAARRDRRDRRHRAAAAHQPGPHAVGVALPVAHTSRKNVK